MKNNPLGALLVGVLIGCGIFTAGISVRHYFLLKRLEALQRRVVDISNTRNAAQALANEAIEYGRRNAALVPLLQQFQLIEKSTSAPATPKPAAK